MKSVLLGPVAVQSRVLLCGGGVQCQLADDNIVDRFDQGAAPYHMGGDAHSSSDQAQILRLFHVIFVQRIGRGF